MHLFSNTCLIGPLRLHSSCLPLTALKAVNITNKWVVKHMPQNVKTSYAIKPRQRVEDTTVYILPSFGSIEIRKSLRTELRFQFIRFAAAALRYASVCFHTERRISAFWRVQFKKTECKIEQKDIITPMHCLAVPSALFGAPFHIDNRTVANCGFWLEYASKTPLEVGADLPRRMRLF